MGRKCYSSTRKQSRCVSPTQMLNEKEMESLKYKNTKLSLQLAEQRSVRTKMQSDIDYLLKEKFEMEFKNNRYHQIICNLERKSQAWFRKFVECSTDLTEIMRIIKDAKDFNSKEGCFENLESASTSQDNRKSFKQVVTPHTVNGYVIHSPTIRIARCNQQITNNETVEQARVPEHNEPQENSSEREENLGGSEESGNEEENEETFCSRGMNGRANEKKPSSDEQEEESDEFTDEEWNNDTEESEEEPNPRQELETIREVSVESSPNHSASIASQYSEVESYLRPNKTGNGTSLNDQNLSTADQNLSMADTSLAVEASTSFDYGAASGVDSRRYFDESDLSTTLNNDEEEEITITPPAVQSKRRKSIAEKKSIGSPVPAKIRRTKSAYRRRSSDGTFSSKDETLTNENASGNGDDFPSKTGDLERTAGETTGGGAATLSNFATDSEMEMPGTSGLTDSLFEKSSIHSTPLIPEITVINKSNDTPLRSKICVRRGRLRQCKRELVVRLERLDMSPPQLSEKIKEYEKTSCSSSATIDPEKENVSMVETVKTKKTPSAKVSTIKAKREESPSLRDSSNIGKTQERPRRAAKPGSLKEPSLSKKMRRSR